MPAGAHSKLLLQAAMALAGVFVLDLTIFLAAGQDWTLAVANTDGSFTPLVHHRSIIGVPLAFVAMLCLFSAFTASRAPEIRDPAPALPDSREEVPIAKLDRNVQTILELVSAAISTSGRYGELLAKAETDLEVLVDPSKIRAAVRTLLAENAAVKTESAALREQLEKACSETQELRRELDKARDEGQIDSLTKLRNRRWFDANFPGEVASARRNSHPLCLAFLDIDHFKRINDTFGHASGDVILRSCGELLRQNVKGRDSASRYGGEEFAICLPRTNIGGATQLMETIRQDLQRNNWVHKKSGREIGVVTASIGIAQLRAGESIEALIERADANMYAAKSAGRNRVVATG